jgi:hypothetical protein
MSATLYETDFHAWALEQARRLRAGEPIDRERVAEEMESLGKSEQRELESRLIILVAHRLKWEFQPEGRSPSWRATIREQQKRIALHLEKNPSLRPLVPEAISSAYPVAVIQAVRDMGTVVEADLPQNCPYGYRELMEELA